MKKTVQARKWEIIDDCGSFLIFARYKLVMIFGNPRKTDREGVEKKDPFTDKKLRPDIPEKIMHDVGAYRENLMLLTNPKTRGFDCVVREDAFQDAIPVLDQAMAAYLDGTEEFRDFKFSVDFHRELIRFIGEKRGGLVFAAWKQDYIGRLGIEETGRFEDSFYGGNVIGNPNCQDPLLNTFHIGGIIGTIELPWIKQIVIRETDAFSYRRRLFLMKGHDGKLLLLVQPRYHGVDLKNLEKINNAVIADLRKRYAPLGIELREMPQGMPSSDRGVNTGYGTFESGRSPFFYIDGNAHAWMIGHQAIARNGLYSRREGESVHFRRGWNGEFIITS
ncbi:hypothetical protein KKB44_03825 [Candidatus Micrarchaeota archaeon]|nr:hypothetical protein [Candidatus Micrarchaeota archaeon]